MTRAAHNAQLDRMAERYARFDRRVAEVLAEFPDRKCQPCQKCGQMLGLGETCPVCRRGKRYA